MQQLVFKPLDEKDITEIGNWFDRLKPQADFSETYSSSEAWLKQQLITQSTYCWTVLDANRPVGFISIEVDNNKTGHLNFAVKPSQRRQGIGRQIIKRVLQFPEVKKLKSLEAAVEADNTGGRKILQENGFVQVGHDKDGFIILVNNGSVNFGRKA